jgi:aspartate--ammonia ligase
MQSGLFPITDYKPCMSIRETEVAIKYVKDLFERTLAEVLNLTRVSAPLFVCPKTGLNDNLSGVERPVSFDVKNMNGSVVEIVQSLAKWKRAVLKRYGFSAGEGIYTDMNAIRRDDELDNLHSIYVDQWDWEKIIRPEDRNIETLMATVRDIFSVFRKVEDMVCERYPFLKRQLPDSIYFITSQELEDLYPTLSPMEREERIAREKKAVFIMKIGGVLKSGSSHGSRAPDYDDWELNGDIIFWYPVLNRAVEMSSMGIRVDAETLEKQLKLSGCEDRRNLPYHRDVLEGRLPLTVGGGIGQSRICMFFLGKAHIGEVHSSVWPEDMVDACEKMGIQLL